MPVKTIKQKLSNFDFLIKYYFKLYILNFSRNIKFFKRKKKYDIVFLCNHKSKGWILDAICQEIAAHWPGYRQFIHYGKGPLPKARVYFISHYLMIRPSFKKFPEMHFAKTFSWYTHPRDSGMSPGEMAFWLNRVKMNLFACRLFHQRNINMGVRREKITTILGGADPEMFKFHTRKNDGYVGFCSAYYERKSPELIFDIVKAMPHRKFLLLGRNWEKFDKFSALTACANFTYIETEYKNYPDYYRQMTVFLSPSKLEGGPIPLIETMMANIVPVASNTGFAPDLIKHGENGFIFSTDYNLEEITSYIDKAFEIKANIRETVLDYSWKNFSENIYALSKKR